MTQPPETCCTKAPTEEGFLEEGKHEKLGDLDVFFAGPENAKVALVGVYDIFGYQPATQKFVVHLAKKGYRVALPDLCYGKAWSLDKFPLTDEIKPEFFKWIQTEFTYANFKDNIKKTVDHVRSKGASKVILFGFCAGAKASIEATKDGLADAGTIGYHPTFWSPEDTAAVNVPVLIIGAKDDPDWTPHFEAVKEPYKSKSESYKFDDVEHGFCAARGDWSGGVYTKRALEAIEITGKWVEKVAH